MNLNKIKDFLIKYNIKKSLSNSNFEGKNEIIHSVGILIDSTYFFKTDDLVFDLQRIGLDIKAIKVLKFKNKFKKNDSDTSNKFQFSDVNWFGAITNNEVLNFINQPFDMLISYYDTEKAPLLQATAASKAKFKVGFSTVDKRLNHFMIDTNAENHTVFVKELNKYLKILNKI